MWEVEYTDEFEVWWSGLTEVAQDAIESAIQILEQRGPACGRPLVDLIKGSRHKNMKELRPQFENIRILFAFDPRRNAILLIGGDKTNYWDRWYREYIPVADALYDQYLAE